MLIIGIILIIISILLIIYSVYSLNHTHKVNRKVDKKNDELFEKQNALLNENHLLSDKKDLLLNEIEVRKDELNSIQENITKIIDSQKELSEKAFENYCEVLDNKYKEQEEEYEMYKDALETSYSNLQLKLLQEAKEVQDDLDKIKATRAAAIQAKLKEKEIKDNSSFYCLKINENDLADIKVLNKMKNQLHNPRILSMLIWKTYFQKPMTELCNNILSTNIKCGIYKITNQLDNMCYIGQSVDIADRWKQHAKCGLGIDTPQGNKLYQAMILDGLWNFSFELLEECPQNQLNEKERYYIQLYQSYDYGYNSSKGINK